LEKAESGLDSRKSFIGIRKELNKLADKRYWKFQNKTAKIGELMIYGYIMDEKWADEDVTPKEFKNQMDALGEIDTLNVYINSGGGSVFAAMAMVSMLKRHKAEKTVYVDGIAASAASFFVGAGKVKMPSNAMIMIHNPMTIGIGNANDFRKLADDMDKIRESMLAIYEEKTALTHDEIIAMLDAETWMTAAEALEYGFADEIEESKQIAASIDGDKLFTNGIETDLSKFKTRPKIEDKGRVLSSANEQKIQQANDLLGDVLGQIKDEPEEDKKKDTRQVPVDLYQKIAINHERSARI
jgi:ATP-dependent Clp protease protease subunit